MVTVTNYQKKTAKDGREFITLELSGGLTLIQSQLTGNWYATSRKCSIPSTFTEEVAKQIVGSHIDGDIVKQETEPYEWVNKQNGEVLILNYQWAYQATPQSELLGSSKLSELQTV